MIRKVFCFVSSILIMFLFLQEILVVKADNSVKQTEVSEYALSWADNKDIPYVWGGGRGKSLEDLASKPAVSGHPNGTTCTKKGRCGSCYATGTDCSGFTSAVYKHFGISITAQSGEQYSEAKKKFTDSSEAVPGDIVWWSGHVGIYLGNDKIIHTNSTDGPTNFPHVSIITKDDSLARTEGYYRYPTYFLRMVDDVSDLKPLSGSRASRVNDGVNNAQISGTLTTESDLTGLVIPETLLEDQNKLPDITELSDKDKIAMEQIKDSIEDRNIGFFDLVKVFVTFLGLVAIIYGILLGVAYLFDRTNNIFEISLLAIITLGKYRIWDESYGIQPGYNERDGHMYCSSGVVIKRILVIEVVGFVLVNGFSLCYDIGRFIISLFS